MGSESRVSAPTLECEFFILRKDGSAASSPGFVIEEESFEAEAGALWSAITPE